MPTIDEMIRSPETHLLVWAAIEEILAGNLNLEGGFRAQYLASRKEALDALRASMTWVITENHAQAIRIDGLQIYPSSPTSADSDGGFTLELPYLQDGQRASLIRLEVADLLSAVGHVDERFPLPAWWAEADQIGRPWRHQKAAP